MPGTTSNALPSFSHDQHHKTDAAKRKVEAQFYKRNEKALTETQTLRTGCSKVEPNIFTPPQIPVSGSQESQNLISWRWSLPLPTNSVWWRSMHTILSYRGNRPTNKATNIRRPPIAPPIADRPDNNTLCR